MGNPSLPVEKFIKDIGKTDIPIHASIDDGGYRPREIFSHGIFRGKASHILSQGADGINLFNQYYGSYISDYKRQTHIEERGYVRRVIMPQLLKELGSMETLKNRNKIYCLCDSSGEYGITSLSPLPLQVAGSKVSVASIFIGDNPLKTVSEEAILFFRLSKPADFGLYVNGFKVTKANPEYIHLFDKARGLKNGEQEYAFVLKAASLIQGDNQISFQSKTGDLFRMKRLEIALKYGDVETHGYF
jgi:hypothetical protein